MRHFFMISSLMLILWACQQTPQSLFSRLIGDWETRTISVTVNSAFGNPDSTRQESFTGKEMERLGFSRLNIQFREDSTYVSNYYNMADSLFFKTSGTWYVKGDSLYVVQDRPEAGKMVSHVVLSDTSGTFSTPRDLDGDGQTDDDYTAISVKSKK